MALDRSGTEQSPWSVQWNGTHWGDVNVPVGTIGSSLLVLASTGCPGGTGLMEFNVNATPPTATWLQRAPSGQAGVVAAIPFGQAGVGEAMPYTP